MVSMLMAALATWFAVADEVPIWDCSKGDRVVWHVKSEFHFPGFPVVDGDQVLLGANFFSRTPDQTNDNRGTMTAYSRADGRKLWGRSHPRLPSRQNDMVGSMFARPTLDGERAYYVSNRGELVCVSVLSGQPEWTLDMPARLGVTKRDWGDVVSPLPGTAVAGSLVFAVTGNGWDFGRPLSSLTAPSLVAADKKTGKVAWTFAVPADDLRYSWSSPVIATVDGQTRLLLPGGDGRLYCFEPTTGRLLWQREPPGFGHRPRLTILAIPGWREPCRHRHTFSTSVNNTWS